MTKILFRNALGVFCMHKEKERVIEKILFKDLEDYEKNKDSYKKKLQEKFKVAAYEKEHIVSPSQDILRKLYQINKTRTRGLITRSINEDNMISSAVRNIKDIEKSINLLSKRLRDWYSLYLPEFERKIEDNRKFSSEIQKKSRQKLMKEYKIMQSMGAELKNEDLAPIMALAERVSNLFELIDSQKNYLEEVTDRYCPNAKEVCGSMIASELIALSGSLRKLVIMPSSTIQMLGAEKALFRHIVSGAKPPRHGVIINHPLLSGAKQSEHGKIARGIASAISIAVKVDYFKKRDDNTTGKELRKELDKKFRRKGR
jgi:nucleolar protein 56